MIKNIKVLSIFLVGSILVSSKVYAGTITKVYLNDNKLLLQQSPIIKDGVTYVPLRTFEHMGTKIGWDQTTKTATIKVGFNTIEQRVGSDIAIVNSKAVQFPGVAFLENGTTYVPIRFISETIGAELQIDSKENSINILYELPKDGGQQYDNFGRIIRNNNLPKNADQYLYIAEGVPNEMYELPLLYEEANFFIEGRHYTRPVNMPSKTQKYREETVKQWREQFENYLDLVLNFDYRNVPSDWASNVANCYSKNYISENTKVANEYVQYAKNKHLIIEGDYYVEPSITYVTMGGYYQRAWIKFRIKSDSSSTGRMMQDIEYELKTNVWYEGYVDLSLGTNYNGSDGTDMIISYCNITTSTMLNEMK